MPSGAKSGRFLVLGAGLVGGLLAIALAERGAEVWLAGEGSHKTATALSYGGVPWWAGGDGGLGSLQAQAPQHWQQLQERHGDLGLVDAELWLHWRGQLNPAAMGAFPKGGRCLSAAEMQEREPLLLGTPLDGAIQLPYLRLDPMRLLSGLGCRYGQLGIKRSGSLWGEELKKAIANNDQTVICAGAHSVGLLEHLHLPVPDLLKLSWAGVWHIPDLAMGGERVLMPLQGLRQQGEQAIGINQPQMVLDPGMAPGPGGDGILLGQTSWFGLSLEKPPNQIQDRQALIAAAELLLPRDIDAVLDSGEWHQQPVSFSSDGLPLVGLLLPDQAISLCAGFSMAFALVPVLVPLVAEAIIDLDWQPLKRLGLHLQRSS